MAEKMTFTPSAETLARVEKGQRFLLWLIPRLSGDDDEKETAVVMLLAQMEDRYAEGVEDAGKLARSIADGQPSSREAKAIADAIEECARQHRAKPITSLD